MKLAEEGRRRPLEELRPISVVRQIDVPVRPRKEVGSDHQTSYFRPGGTVGPAYLWGHPKPDSPDYLERDLIHKDVRTIAAQHAKALTVCESGETRWCLPRGCRAIGSSSSLPSLASQLRARSDDPLPFGRACGPGRIPCGRASGCPPDRRSCRTPRARGR